ncbi:glycoside hydrolase family 2 TIM barrel-domain containing protein [Peribacillus kribbensis]|uniref:glycoside hydrolase family 2 TIM barrel-domain containing protein n=1 Tax=Peribacillus kribbensis TaxID=356658 RepID=UPI00041037BC|nr:glycoside hydrolase family 2 TIM barrel-domain containing protein [Peribacillus kribbensis]
MKPLKDMYSGLLAVLVTGSLMTATIPQQVTAAKSEEPAAEQISYQKQRSLDFDQNWKFALVNTKDITDPDGRYENAESPEYNDSSWRTLNLPHDWSIEQKPSAEPPAEAGTGFLDGGLGWYRKKFTLPAAMKDKKISIEFDGVYMDSSVYINGHLLGTHPYGYTGFSYDISEWAHTDGKTPNVIAVKVQNKLPTSRWYSGSGIYRDVRLTITDSIHVKRWGTFVTTPDLEATLQKGYANVHVQTDISNETGKEQKAELFTKIIDSDGKIVAKNSSPAVLTNSKSMEETLRVKNPKLWSTEQPYLYSVESEIKVDGKTVDTYSTPFGIRYFKLDPDKGFSLNGRFMKIQGVNMHHDLGALGSATNYDAVYRQLKIMKSMGVNAVRTSHNPPSPDVLRACNELGMVMMVEAFDAWVTPKRPNDYARFFNEYSDRDIKEMVNSAKNWPAVILWSIGNEIPDSTRTIGVGITDKLMQDIRSVDTTRPITIGSDKYRSVPRDGTVQDQIARKVDALGLNYNNAASVDLLHQKYPNLILFESESSSETSTRGVYKDPGSLNTPVDYTPGQMGTSSYDNNLASWTFSGEYGLKKDRDRAFFAGQFLWSGFDYLGEPTPYWDNFPVKSSFFGAVDTAGFAKDAYYLYKSQWTKEPMVHLVPMNWTNYKPGEEVDVWAYSNVDTVELFLNGKSLGVRTFDEKKTLDGRSYLETTEASGDEKNQKDGAFPGSYTSPNGSAGKLHLTWKVPFEKGTLTAIAKKNGKQVAKDEIKTAGDPYTLKLTPDKKVIQADGKSLSFVTAEVVDENGTVVPDADPSIHFEVKGGRLAGVDNGRQESSESYQSSNREAFNGKALAIIQSGTNAGPITISAESENLIPQTAVIFADKKSGGHNLIGIEPVEIRVKAGERPELPAKVEGVYADGTVQSLAVNWTGISKLGGKKLSYTIHGRVKGTAEKAEAVVSVYDVKKIEEYHTAVPTGTAPSLPDSVKVLYTDGITQLQPVSWERISSQQYQKPGEISVEGYVFGTTRKAKAVVRVTNDYKADSNLALAAGQLQAKTGASFSGSAGTVPAALNDGNIGSGGWSNQYSIAATSNLPAMSGARKEDWVELKWNRPQTVDNTSAYFTVNSSNSLPSKIEVTYWNGKEYVPAPHQKVKWADASNKPVMITFDSVSTSRIRYTMTSGSPGSSSGNVTIVELEVFGKEVNYKPGEY